jgi:HK97 family phage major capsid protein
MKPEELKSEFRNLVAELKESVQSQNDEAVAKINDRMDSIEFQVGTLGKSAQTTEQKNNEVVNQFKDSFVSFAKGNRHELRTVETKSGYHPAIEGKSANHVRFDFASAGALLLPAQISEDIIRNVVEATPILELARVTTTDRSEYKRRKRLSTPGGTWLGEDSASTKGKIEFGTVDITPHKWAAQYGVSIEMLSDTGYNLVGEMTDAFRDDASVDLGSAFMNGSGVGQPTGMVGRITNFNATQLALSTSDLIRMQESLKNAYHANASWLFTRATRGNIRTQFLGTDGLQYLWEPSFKAGIPTLLLGAPVYIAAEGDLAGKASGNFTGGQVYAVYGDFAQGYEIVRRTDMYMIDDPYSDASSFTRNFHIMARFGGNVIKSEALVQITAAGS